MPLKGFIGSRGKENPSHVKFKAQLDAAISSAASAPPGARVDPAAVEGMLALVRSKEISPGDALSCFKTHFREGTPEEQCNSLRVLIQFVGSDPHLANMLHMELASRRWRERFLHLAASPHPEVRPMLIDALQTWSASYRGHDIGMHYQSTLRELNAGPMAIRPGGPGYNAQMTGYSMQTTGAYPVPPPPAGYPLPAPPGGYPAPPPGYPPFGPGYPPPPMRPQPTSRRAPETVAEKLEQLTSEVDVLREAIRAFEKTLVDYKAQRCNFAALSTAMDKGQRSADRCTALQSQMEGLLGTSDADESLTARVFSTNDAVVAALEQWTRLANQELVPDDAPTPAATAAPPTSAGPSTSGGAGTWTAPPPPPPAPQQPSALDLLLGDDMPAPTPAPAAAMPAAASGVGANIWSAFPAPAAGAGAALAAAGNIALPVVPASDMEGLRAQVLALSSELEKERKIHKTNMDTQEAFAKQELAQVKAQLQARIAELEGALAQARQGVLPSVPSLSSAPSVNSQGPAFGVAGSAFAPTPMYPTLPLTPNPPAAPTVTPAMPTGLSANNPFAATYTAAPSYGSLPPPAPTSVGGGVGPFASMQAPLGAPAPSATAPARAAAPAPDFFSAFDDLAVLSPKPPAAPAPAAAPAPIGSGGGSLAGAAPGAPGGAAGAPAGGAGSWVNFGL